MRNNPLNVRILNEVVRFLISLKSKNSLWTVLSAYSLLTLRCNLGEACFF
jgi:hypothetical protein